MMQRQATAARNKGGEIIGVSPDGAPIRAESPSPKKKGKRVKSSIKKERAVHLSMMNALGMTAKDLAAVHFSSETPQPQV
jgi:hypothetical protein